MSPNSEEQTEQALRAALRREAAPPDFAAGVLARTRGPLPLPKLPHGLKPPGRWPRRPLILAVAAALAALAIIPAVVMDRERREEAKGLHAKQDLLTALAITRDQLQQVREKIRSNTRDTQ